MKLFLREHILLIVLQSIQLSFTVLILWLSGFHHVSILFYCVVISFFFLLIYLVHHYYQHRHMYKKLSTPSSELQQLLERTDETPIGTALDQLTKSQYKLFMTRLKKVEDEQTNHLTFMDRWVHQMKTPLSVIELSAQELDEPESSSIREETDRMKSGLQTVLYMARMRTMKEDFHIKPVNLKTLIQAVNQENKRFYIRNDVYPHMKVSEELTVETDEKWLFFMIEQLLHNAVKYSADRSNRVDINIHKSAGAAVLAITDYGIGIPAHDQKRLFQAFYTGDNGRIFHESTGMGLYLTKEVADYLGHQMVVESTVDVGTTFRICFTKTQTIS